MKLAVILENSPDSVLDREEIEVAGATLDDLDGEAVDEAVSKVLETWTFSVGDTIKIRIAGAAGE